MNHSNAHGLDATRYPQPDDTEGASGARLAASDLLGWDRAVSQARRRGLLRTVQALFREGMLDARQLVWEGASAWLPLWRQQALVRLEGLTLGPGGACRLEGALSLHAPGAACRLITHPSALLSCLAPTLGSDADSAARLLKELDNSVDNDALCLSHRFAWGRELRRQAQGHGTFFEWLQQVDDINPCLLLEQWGTLGHPWHPCHKTKLGLTADEVMAMSPEFGVRLDVPVAAIRARHAHVETAHAGLDYREWFAHRFPQVWQAWQQALCGVGLLPSEWLPLPVHPLQADRMWTRHFVPELKSGALRLLDGVTLPAAPTMSFRTVVPEGSRELPHIKLPVSLRLTSVERTVSPKSAVMGPRLTALLRRILEIERGFGGSLDVLGEDIGIHLRLPAEHDDRARQVSALFRANAMTRRGDGLFPYPVGAMFADSPLDGAPLVNELIRASTVTPLRFFEQYLAVASTAVLGPYLRYGIAFEAHQQNSFMLVDAQGCPRRLLLRDFGDLRVHRPTLTQRNHDLLLHREGHTAFDDPAPVRDKLLHAVFLCHFAELGLLIGQEHGIDEGDVWSAFSRAVSTVFEQMQPRSDPARWEAERHALLEAPWPAKAFLRMRLSDCSQDVVGRMPNPLKAV